jgi:hypothetical protein
MSIRADDPRLADFTPEEIARGLPEETARQEADGASQYRADPKYRNVAAYNKIIERDGRRIQQTFNAGDELLSEMDIGPADRPEERVATPPSAEELAERAAEGARQAFLAQSRSDAFSRLKALLNRFGLGELEGAVNSIITSGTVDLNDANAIIFAIRDQPAYQRRFAGNAARTNPKRPGGPLPELDPASYIGLEESYRQIMQSNGLPTGFYDRREDFQRLIEGDVSPSELQERIEQGYRRVQDADPEVKRQMRELYGVDDNALTAYFLDPDKAVTLLTRRARAAQISARGREQAGLQLTAASAEDLAARGITPEQAQEAFARRGQLEGLYEPLFREETLSDSEALGATFGYDVQAQRRLERRRAQRVGEFQAGGGFARTTGATSGTVETGVGTAQ